MTDQHLPLAPCPPPLLQEEEKLRRQAEQDRAAALEERDAALAAQAAAEQKQREVRARGAAHCVACPPGHASAAPWFPTASSSSCANLPQTCEWRCIKHAPPLPASRCLQAEEERDRFLASKAAVEAAAADNERIRAEAEAAKEAQAAAEQRQRAAEAARAAAKAAAASAAAAQQQAEAAAAAAETKAAGAEARAEQVAGQLASLQEEAAGLQEERDAQQASAGCLCVWQSALLCRTLGCCCASLLHAFLPASSAGWRRCSLSADVDREQAPRLLY